MTPDQKRADAFAAVAPFIFVLIWSTGWIAGGFVAQNGDPLYMLVLRYICATLLLVALACATNAPWPDARMARHAAVSGILLHAIYLGGVWWAVSHGVPAGISGIIAGLQPVLTALFAPALLGEKISARKWAGIACGFIGLALVIYPKLAAIQPGQVMDSLMPLFINLIAMIGVTLGTFYQKRFLGGGDIRTITVWQYVSAAIVTIPVSLLFENQVMAWNMTSILTLAWSVIALSIGAIFLLLYLVNRGEVSRAAAYIFLVPPVSALMAWFFFRETLIPVQIVGMLITATGVWLATRN